MADRTSFLFGECASCGERWKLATLPVDLMKIAKAMRNCKCPNCGEGKRLFSCPTEGDGAVTAPRAGKVV